MWATLLILLTTYFALSQVGVADSRAAFWAATAAALRMAPWSRSTWITV